MLRVKGKFLTKKTNYEIKQSLQKDHNNGYLVCCIKEYRIHVHKLIFVSFNGEVGENKVIDHIDRNKLNNTIENLRAVSRSENALNRVRKQPQSNKVIAISVCNENDIICFENRHEAAEYFDISESIIRYYIKKQTNCNGYILTWDNQISNLSGYKPVGVIKGYDFGSKYLANNEGTIITGFSGIYRTVRQQDLSGYKAVTLKNKGNSKGEMVHRIVAKLFLPNGEENYNTSLVVNHLNENKFDNRAINLEWTTRKDNSVYSCAKKVLQICPKTYNIINNFISIAEAGKHININKGVVQALKSGGLCGGFYWVYETDKHQIKDKIKLERCKQPTRWKSVSQIDVNTGEVIKTFKSISEAGNEVGANPRVSGICRAIKKGGICCGYKWRYN